MREGGGLGASWGRGGELGLRASWGRTAGREGLGLRGGGGGAWGFVREEEGLGDSWGRGRGLGLHGGV